MFQSSPRSTPNSSPRSRSAHSPPVTLQRGNSLPSGSSNMTQADSLTGKLSGKLLLTATTL